MGERDLGEFRVSFFLVVRFLHIVSAIWFIGGILARQIVRAYAKRTADVQRYAILKEAAERIEQTMVIPGSMAVVVIGVILGLITGAPILGFLQGAVKNWLLVSVIIILLGSLPPPLIFLPWRKRLNVLLSDALAKGQMTPELRAEIHNPTVRNAHWLELVGMGVVLFLMVFKPF
jgi:uncharacterized membrane protein